MNSRHAHTEGFVSVVFVELCVVLLGFFLVSILVFGSWPARIIVFSVAGGICAWAYWEIRRSRFRPGDQVEVTLGPRQGLNGTVLEPLHGGSGARVALVVGDHTEIVDFHRGYGIQKMCSQKTA